MSESEAGPRQGPPPPTRTVPRNDHTATLASEPGQQAGGLSRGACLGRYVILGALGSGGMGNVYAAYDPELDRKIALKVLRQTADFDKHPDRGDDRLLREGRAAARLNHPNILAVHDVGTAGERSFVAMEMIQGQTLRDWLRAEPRPWRRVLEVFLAAGQGLAAAHRAGLVHRDFKPSNVMLAEDDQVKVLDFGLARPSDQALGAEAATASGSDPSLPRLTATGDTPGTPAYMAPEQRAGRGADARSDQYSFCLSLHEALFDTPDATAERPASRAAANSASTARDRVAGAPAWLRRLLEQGLEKDPARRHPSMDHLLVALARGRSRRRNRLLLLAAGLACVAMLLLWPGRVSEAALCSAGEDRIDEVWNSHTRQAARSTFLASGLPFAEQSWFRASQTMDQAAADWVGMYREACEATHRLGEQSAALLDRRMACLEDRRRELDSLAQLFTHADAELVRRAPDTASRLPSLQPCADRRALAAVLAPPEDPQSALAVAGLRDTLAQGRVLELAGRYREASPLAESAVQQARSLAYTPVLAEALYFKARVDGRLGHIDTLREGLLATVQEALRSRHDQVLARAMLTLIISSYTLGRPEEGQIWGELVQGALARLEDATELEILRQHYLGIIANQAGQHEKAIDHFQRALSDDPELTWVEQATAKSNIAYALRDLGRYQEAAQMMEQALISTENAYGTEHPLYSEALRVQASIQLRQGLTAEALDTAERALSLREQSLGEDHLEVAANLRTLAEVRLSLGQAKQAQAELQRALVLLEKGRMDPLIATTIRFLLARSIALQGGNNSQALSQAREARAQAERYGSRGQSLVRDIDLWLEKLADGAQSAPLVASNSPPPQSGPRP